MAYLSEAFPHCFSFGTTRSTRRRTTVVAAASGVTEANANWSYPLHLYTVPLNNRSQGELENLLDYWHAAGARENTFPLLDPIEYKTCVLTDTPAQDDQLLGTAAAAQTDFQLVKNYTRGGSTKQRKITRPIDASVLVEVDGALKVITTDYTIEAGGIIRFTAAMVGGEVVKWGGQFHTPCRFGDDDVAFLIHNRNSQFIGNAALTIEEVRE